MSPDRKKYVIGNMTGNSLDATDCVLAEFDERGFVRDVADCSIPYSNELRKQISELRSRISLICKDPGGPSISRILADPTFEAIHKNYVRLVAKSIKDLLALAGIPPKKVACIGFHGQTLGHLSSSLARSRGHKPYSIQMGAGSELARLTDIPVVNDFRSDFLLHGFEGAPLVPFHNAHISWKECDGNGCYLNGGNTSNFAWIQKGKVVSASDCGPFNEYVDRYVMSEFGKTCDLDGQIGQRGKLSLPLLETLFEMGRAFYDAPFPKSGDPQQYQGDRVQAFLSDAGLHLAGSRESIVRTLEYLSAYVVALSLSELCEHAFRGGFLLFGGGWKNPVIRGDFGGLVAGKAPALPLHKLLMQKWCASFVDIPCVHFSLFGKNMEARLMADMAWHRLQGIPWQTPEYGPNGIPGKVLSGLVSIPGSNSVYSPLSRVSNPVA